VFTYIPILDELCFLVVSRASKYQLWRQVRNASVDKTATLGKGVKLDRNVVIGKGTYCGDDCHFFAGELSSVVVGKFCAIGYNVHIKARTHDLAQPTPTETESQNSRLEKDITIGDYVWIGDNVFIREGVVIGSHAVVAANSVVIKDVAEREIVGGVPAKHIRFNNQL
jgi:maltose O-acetyltransferase